MERILLVEDNKSLSKLISLKISSALSFEVDIAYSFKEAQLFMRKHKYFIALLDINLPDAPNGEIVDSVIENKIPAIVLSGNMNKAFRREMLKKEIIDYVGKGGIEDIDYIIQTISRLDKNRQHKVLVVDDSRIVRSKMQNILENLFFKVYAVGHGEEALGMLKEFPDIRIVITDYAMPVMDGLELTKTIRKEFKKDQLSILAVSANDDEEVSAMFLKSGATDFIKKPFSKEEFSCRVNNTIEALENIDIITNQASRDALTGLYNRRYFFEKMTRFFEKSIANEREFVIAMIDIDNFKQINDAFGHDAGDRTIIYLSEILRANLQENDMVARFGDTEFCLVLKDKSRESGTVALEELRRKIENSLLLLEDGREISFTVSVGATSQYENTLDEMVNQADMMLYNAKHSGKNRVEVE